MSPRLPDAIERWPIDRLRPYARNPRTHDASQVAQIAASIVEFGWTNPVLVSSDGEVIAGHGRLEAAKRLGLDTVPVVILDHLTPAQRRAYVIADNKLALNAGWDDAALAAELQALLGEDFDLSLTGFSDGELDSLLAADVQGDAAGDGGSAPPVIVPEPPRHPASRAGDLWLLGDHRLLCGDSTSREDVRRLMNGERAALFATDPPYLVDYDGSNHPTRNKDWSQSYGVTWDDSSQGAELYDGFIAAAVAEAIAEDAAWYCWHASRRQAMLESCWKKFDVLHHQQIIWAKSRPVLTRSIMLWAHEPCLFGWRSGKKPRVNREGFDSWPTTVWNIPSSEIETREHPTSKPVRVFSLPMELHTLPGDICYEPFSGSGSQHIAGEKTGRRVYGMELSETFCDVIINRWQAFSGKTAVLDCDGATYAELLEQRLGEAKEAA